jgi:AAA+ ATPase superfamily predicted ATPase
MFGRTELLDRFAGSLTEVHKTGKGRILAVRGRRQVGKSTAVTAFVEQVDTPHAYFTGVKLAPMHRQLETLAEAFLGSRHPVADVHLLFDTPPTTWREAFNRWALAARNAPVIVVLDEFPWAVEADPSLEGELQVAWDTTLSKLPILLILIGSDVAMMSRLVEHDRPLFGRVTPMVVPALNPAEVAEALPGRSAMEIFDAYLVTGGYPRLVERCAAAKSTSAYVRTALIDPFSDLVISAQLVLDAEFTDAASTRQVLTAIGAEAVTRPGFNDVLSAISDPGERGAAQTAITRALKILEGPKDLIRIEVPSGAASNSRLRRYRLTDPYLQFWFRFIARHLEDISRSRGDIAVAAFNASWTSWRGRAIEPHVNEALTRLGATHPELAGVQQAGPWWNRDNSLEVDIVARTAEDIATVGTIKWRPRVGVNRAEMAELVNARNVIPHAGGARLLAVCPSGLAPGASADIVLRPEDLLAAWGA